MHRPILNYDDTDMPAVYDRARDHGPQVLDLWLRTVARTARGYGPIETVLDLGCGTGRFSFGLADRFGARVVGIDPSTKMLDRARSKVGGPAVQFAAARGEDLPVRSDGFDLIFMSMVFHHFAAPGRVASECRRVVRDGGVAFMCAGTADRIDVYPYVAFFAASVPLLRDILPTTAAVRETFEAAGFRTIEQGIVVQEVAATHAQYADKLEAGGDSVLVRLDRDELDAGLARLRAHGRELDPKPVMEPIDFFVFG